MSGVGLSSEKVFVSFQTETGLCRFRISC